MRGGRTSRLIVRLARLPAPDRRLLAAAAALLAGMRMGLWLLPFAAVQRLAARLERGRRAGSAAPDAPDAPDAARRVVWAVEAASRYVPGSRNCLTRALAARVLLARRGVESRLRFGVRRGPAGELRAHAWVEGSDGVLIGDMRDLSRYTPLRPLEGAER